MRREHGIFVLEEKNGEYTEGFQGIILDTTENEKYVKIGKGEYSCSNGKYYVATIDTVYIEDISPIENLKKHIQEFFESKYPNELEMGFPGIAITERVREIISNY